MQKRKKIDRTTRNQFSAFTEEKIQEFGDNRAKPVCPLALTFEKERAGRLVTDRHQREWHFTPDLPSPLEKVRVQMNV